MDIETLVLVAPLAGARIEIYGGCCHSPSKLSLPSRERGLKYYLYDTLQNFEKVAPLAGARIEIRCCQSRNTPYQSLPSRERGLKYSTYQKQHIFYIVAPLAGARIEIYRYGNKAFEP